MRFTRLLPLLGRDAVKSLSAESSLSSMADLLVVSLVERKRILAEVAVK